MSNNITKQVGANLLYKFDRSCLISKMFVLISTLAIKLNKGNKMKKYELLATLKPNLDIDEADKVVARVEELAKGFGGAVLDTEKMGRKKLAYDVKGFRDGFMFVQRINLPADKITEFKRQLKLNENIIRTMFVEIKKAKSAC